MSVSGVFHTGALGKLMTVNEYEVWVCVRENPCVDDENDMVCFTYSEMHNVVCFTYSEMHIFVPWGSLVSDMVCFTYSEMHIFVPWGLNSVLRMVKSE